MSWSSKWSSLRVLILILLKCATSKGMVPLDTTIFPRVIVAASHTALAGDLAVMILGLPPLDQSTTTIQTTVEDADIVMEEEDEENGEEEFDQEKHATTSRNALVLRVLRLDGFTSELVGEVPVEVVPASGGNVSMTVPCGFLSRGGTYSLQVQRESSPVPSKLTDIVDIHDVQMTATLDVRWPTPSLSLEPQHFKTYPGQPVLVTLEYTGISCTPSLGVPVAKYSLQLIYCGSSVLSCDTRNKSHVQVLYAEDVKGFPIQKVVALRCELFGLPGHYALRLKPSEVNPSAPTTSAYIKVEWSDQFVFNVQARSVYPCDGGGGGVSVLFEYPACRLQGDRVRVYGRLRADVASLAPPSTLHYLAELKAPSGSHSLKFHCDIFTETFVEYCFIYVSEAITGAMANVRVDCVPTFPLQEGAAGGWGPWSQWTSCSSSCAGGTRNRYRFCDKPPPKYGAKFCQGKAVETESCGGSSQLDLRGTWSSGDWECRHGKGLAAERPEVTAEVGTQCRCGCRVHLHENEPRKILAASTQACPGRSFWMIEACHVTLELTSPPPLQRYVVLSFLSLPPRQSSTFHSENFPTMSISLQSSPVTNFIFQPEPGHIVMFHPNQDKPEPGHIVRLHLDQARFPCPNQYVRARDGDSLGAKLLADVAFDKSAPPGGSVVSSGPRMLLEFFSEESTAAGESCIGGFLAHATMFPKSFSENASTVPAVSMNPKILAVAGRWALWLTPVHLAAASLLVLMFLVSVFLALQYAFKYRKYQIAEDLDSLTDNSICSGSMQDLARRARALSSATLISEVVSLVRLPRRGSARHARLEEASADLEDSYESTETHAEGDDEGSIESGTLRNKDSENGSQKTITPSAISTPTRRPSTSSTSAPGQPEVKYARPVKLRTVGPISPVSEEPSTSECSRRYSVTSASTSVNNVRVPHPKPSTLLQAKGCSPASTSSNISALRCGKESKDRRNRERLLQGPGSEFSLANPDMDLELDYYDYNVVNAGAAPGSYLGMDPAFLVWIPPLDPGDSDILATTEEDHHYEEIPERRSQAGSRIKLDTEGLALTPSEYKRIREAKTANPTLGADGCSQGRQSEVQPRKLDPGESRLHDEIIMEYRARLSEGMLPIHRLLEESRVRVSEESLTRHSQDDSDVIPNRLLEDSGKSEKEGTETRFTPKTNRNRLSDEHERSKAPTHELPRTPGGKNRFFEGKKFSAGSHSPPNRLSGDGERSRTRSNGRNRFSDDFDGGRSSGARRLSEETVRNRAFDENEHSRTPTGLAQRRNNQDSSKPRRDLDRDSCEVNEEVCVIVPNQKTPNLQRRYKDIADLNSICESKIANSVNIPLREFPRGRVDSPVRVHRSRDGRKETAVLKEVQSPDYGVEADMKEESKGFYDLIGEGEDGFKFADDDEDYIDNKVTV